MSAVLARTVVVRHPDTLEATALLAGEPVPDWASDLVDPDALEGDDDTGATPAKKSTSRRSSGS